MINRNIYISVILSFVCLIQLSCTKDFLNIIPQGNQIAVTLNDYDLLMNNKELSHYEYSGGWQGPAIMGDEIAAEAVYFNNSTRYIQAAFKWEDRLNIAEDTDWASKIWLDQLYTINKVINEVMNATQGTVAQKKAIKAEAQANRAWIYFQLINFYGKPYSTSSSGTDPGFPIVLTANINENKFDRTTVQAVYDFIIKDFEEAIIDLPLTNKNGLRFNKAAAEGLLGKVFLYMGRNEEALELFNSAFTHNAARPVPAVLYNYNQEFDAGGKFLPINMDGPSNSPGKNFMDFTESLVSKDYYNDSYNGNGYGNDAFVLDPKSQDLFKPSDLRLNFYAAQFPYEERNPSGRLRKYGVTYSRFGLQLAELYLLRAEVRARLNDIPGAKEDVEELRKNRMPEADASIPVENTTSIGNMVKYVFEERIREFAMEGYRWFDMRRESVDPIFSGKTYIHTIFNYEQQTEMATTLRNVRLTMRLPYNIINTNQNFTDNP